ncbi:MAG: hypothetical protein LBG66_02265 [Gallionellaceae bacterium]|jgi:apolipoprotein N-acyltransferase|nr:hypothetical protein [Gallionellaceae bacterium]
MNDEITPPPSENPPRRRPPAWAITLMTWLVGLLTFALGVGWIIYDHVVNFAEIPYFAIPLVLSVPVIVAVTFRNFWD